MSSKATIALAKECRRLEESCLYTSTNFFIWLRWLRIIRLAMTSASLICGAIAGWKTLAGHDDMRALIAGCAFLAGLLPTLGAALKLEKNIQEAARLAGEFKNLQDRFRQAALVSSKKNFEQFEADVKPLMKRLEEARKPSATPPEVVFWFARRKIKAGHYTFDVDETESEPATVEKKDAPRRPEPIEKTRVATEERHAAEPDDDAVDRAHGAKTTKAG